MDDLVGSVAVLTAELQSARRQQTSLQFLLSSAEARLSQQPQGRGGSTEEVEGLRAELKAFAILSVQQIRDLRALDEPFGSPVDGQPGVGGGELGLERIDSRLTEESFAGAAADIQVHPMSGSAAVNIARVERLRATRLQVEVAKLKEDREHLLERLELEAAQPQGAALCD
jgi:hypothetical protein